MGERVDLVGHVAVPTTVELGEEPIRGRRKAVDRQGAPAPFELVEYSSADGLILSIRMTGEEVRCHVLERREPRRLQGDQVSL